MSDDSKKCPIPDLIVLAVEVSHEHDSEDHPENGKGPSRVNSGAYKRGWETIFGAKVQTGEA